LDQGLEQALTFLQAAGRSNSSDAHAEVEQYTLAEIDGQIVRKRMKKGADCGVRALHLPS
jgi:hypothetical protein